MLALRSGRPLLIASAPAPDWWPPSLLRFASRPLAAALWRPPDKLDGRLARPPEVEIGSVMCSLNVSYLCAGLLLGELGSCSASWLAAWRRGVRGSRTIVARWGLYWAAVMQFGTPHARGPPLAHLCWWQSRQRQARSQKWARELDCVRGPNFACTGWHQFMGQPEGRAQLEGPSAARLMAADGPLGARDNDNHPERIGRHN